MPDKTPYFSFCVHSRNDDHGGDMYRRMKTCYMGFFEQAERHRLKSEIVLVDWNPPMNKPLLKDAYQWPKQSQFCTIRIITVPPYIHERYENWEKMPVNYTVAQNVAIRRARGKFILCTTSDVLLSDDLVRFLASEKLDEDRLYRMDRCEVRRNVTRLHSLDEQLSYCRNNILRIDLFQPELLLGPGMDHIPGLFTGAPGDFILLAKKYWDRLRGIPETDILGRVSGTILCYAAYFAGAKAEALRDPMRLYHIEHGARTNSPESNLWAKLGLEQILPKWFSSRLKKWVRQFLPVRDELTRLGIPCQNSPETIALIVGMFEGKRSLIYNDETWGLRQEQLQEFAVTTADYEAEDQLEVKVNHSRA